MYWKLKPAGPLVGTDLSGLSCRPFRRYHCTTVGRGSTAGWGGAVDSLQIIRLGSSLCQSGGEDCKWIFTVMFGWYLPGASWRHQSAQVSLHVWGQTVTARNVGCSAGHPACIHRNTMYRHARRIRGNASGHPDIQSDIRKEGNSRL